MSFNWFVSVDDHLIEPARLWPERLPRRWRETGPRIVRDGDSEFWVSQDRQIVTTGLNAVAGKRREEFSPEPITYEDMRLGCYARAARVADMNTGHVLASMPFPSFPRYCGQVFDEATDRELGLPSIHSGHWDPLWRACEDAGYAVSLPRIPPPSPRNEGVPADLVRIVT